MQFQKVYLLRRIPLIHHFPFYHFLLNFYIIYVNDHQLNVNYIKQLSQSSSTWLVFLWPDLDQVPRNGIEDSFVGDPAVRHCNAKIYCSYGQKLIPSSMSASINYSPALSWHSILVHVRPLPVLNRCVSNLSLQRRRHP